MNKTLIITREDAVKVLEMLDVYDGPLTIGSQLQSIYESQFPGCSVYVEGYSANGVYPTEYNVAITLEEARG